MIRLIFLIFLLLPHATKAAENIDLSGWKTLPVLHEGRIKPLDSFARIYLKTFSGKTQIDDLNAPEWLAEIIFNPEQSIQRKVFNGRDKNGKRISLNYEELAKHIRDNDKLIKSLSNASTNELTTSQISLLEFYENFILSTQLMRSMTVFLLPDKNSEEQLKKIILKKGSNIEKYSIQEKNIAAQAFASQTLREGGKDNVLLRVINTHGEWLSPWSAKNTNSLAHWKNMFEAYRTQDVQKWDEAVKNAKINNSKLKTEVIFNTLNLHHIAAFLYFLTILFFIFSNFIKENLFAKSAFITLTVGVFANLLHTALRVYILDRPPVGTLYESVLFVALICAAGFMFMAWKQKNQNHILLGGLSGLLLLLTAQAFSTEDTMGTLVAVLNTDFWLMTHVICITMGYGACLLTSLTAHYYLIQKIREKETKKTFTTIKTLSLFSLLLVTVGTILGGLWADQSWGRFWGWDPKENGALLIVLWLIWILHSHLTNHINRIGFVIGMAFLSIIVILAWFGVNLLSVGLHSYGFISGIAWGIGLFCAAETLIIGGLWLYPKMRHT